MGCDEKPKSHPAVIWVYRSFCMSKAFTAQAESIEQIRKEKWGVHANTEQIHEIMNLAKN